MSIVQENYNTEKNLFNFEEYFDNITIEDFNKPELITNRLFKININQYIRHYFETSDYPIYSKEKL